MTNDCTKIYRSKGPQMRRNICKATLRKLALDLAGKLTFAKRYTVAMRNIHQIKVPVLRQLKWKRFRGQRIWLLFRNDSCIICASARWTSFAPKLQEHIIRSMNGYFD